MKDSVLLSIKPKGCELIASGKKTIEIRKTAPKVKTPFKCYIYETRGFERVGNDNLNFAVGGNGRGAVIGEFVCDRIIIDKHGENALLFEKDGCLAFDVQKEYAPAQPLYGWHISALVIYDKPKELTAFHRPCPNDFYCESCAMHTLQPVPHCGNYALEIRRPPQSWCYAEDQT